MNHKERRLLLQSELERYFDEDDRVIDASNHVSFQPDENTVIKYPHITYSRDPAYVFHADNIPYLQTMKYEVTCIDRNPDSPIFDELMKRSNCSHKASFAEDGLNHYVFDLYY